MHYLIRLIVEGEDVDEANSHAECVMDNLIEWHEFDWYQIESSDSRWEDCWMPVRLNSDTGREWVKSAMDAQFYEFKQSMQSIRQMVSHFDDKQIFNEEFAENHEIPLSRYYFTKAGGCHSNTCQLYDTFGGSVMSHNELERYFSDSENLWVVQVDCHN